MRKDRLFAVWSLRAKDFDFGRKTAAVFDDMLSRSVPFYTEIQRMLAEIAADFAKPGTQVVDLGCSTCNTFVALDPLLPRGVRFVGVDGSAEMLKKSREKLAQYGVKRSTRLVCADLNRGIRLSNASVVILNLTLQFIRPPCRRQLLEDVAGGLNDGGCLILVEKVLSRGPRLNRLFIQNYHDFKERNGYSRLEIAQKREALENVLIPYRVEEDRELVMQAGLSQFDVFFKWYNFCGMVAVK